MMERVITYVDGFNLYFGLKAAGWRKYYWLNVQELAQRLLKPQQSLISTKYFTARITDPPDKVKRQSTYIEALDTLALFDILYGRYQNTKHRCYNCNHVYTSAQEKMTDVNIAIELIMDAYEDKFDTALLISGDADLVGPISIIGSKFPKKRIICAFPPRRKSNRLAQVASGHFVIGETPIRKSQFTKEVTKPGGFVLQRPVEWK